MTTVNAAQIVTYMMMLKPFTVPVNYASDGFCLDWKSTGGVIGEAFREMW